MEAEQISSQSMRYLIAVWEVIREIQTLMITVKCKPVQFITIAKTFDFDESP